MKDLDVHLTGEIYNSDESWKVLTTLCSFGGRWSGTKGAQLAVEYILKKFKEYDLDDPHLEEFRHLGWSRGESKLEIIAPINKEIFCLGQSYAASAVVEAPLINCEWGHPDIFKKLGKKVKGKIVLLRTQASHSAIPGKALEETDTMRYVRAVKAGAVGFINWNQAVGFPPMTRAMRSNLKGEIPATGISYSNGKLLMELMGKGPVTLRMTEKHHYIENIKSWNVVAEIKGTSKADEIVVFGAHHDGRDVSQATFNNASGAVAAIEAARALSKHKGSYKRTIKIIIFSAEVCGLIGSFAYVQAHKDEMKNIKFMLNLDTAGRPDGSGLGIRIEGRPELIPYFKFMADDMKLPYDMTIIEKFDIGSDHIPFLLQGIPTAYPQISDPERTSGWPYEMGIKENWRETQEDTIDKTKPEFVRRDAITVARILMRIANSDEIPAKHLTFAETKKLIEDRGYTERLYNRGYRTAEELAKYGFFDKNLNF